MNGIALTVLISQLPKLFGFSIDGGGPVQDLWAIGVAMLARVAPTGAPSSSARHAGDLILLLQGHKRMPGSSSP
jgi:hypothetical protein